MVDSRHAEIGPAPDAGITRPVQVEEPALAIMVPLLERGLRERQTAIKRKTAIIIDNMCKLVEDEAAAAPFLPKLLPGLEKLAAEVSDPEARSVCSKAQATLVQARLTPSNVCSVATPAIQILSARHLSFRAAFIESRSPC